jgi:rhodanese-related sulfurtransferase
MATILKLPDPIKAKAFFENKLSFTTGPAEVDHYKKNGEKLNIIDVRATEDFTEEHIPGAISLTEDRWDSFTGLSKDKVNILYCYSGVCHLAALAAVKFAGAGYPVMEMDGGFSAWKEMQLETERGQVKKTA